MAMYISFFGFAMWKSLSMYLKIDWRQEKNSGHGVGGQGECQVRARADQTPLSSSRCCLITDRVHLLVGRRSTAAACLGHVTVRAVVNDSIHIEVHVV